MCMDTLTKEDNMKITALVENITKDENLLSEHGLSLHILTRNHKILFDVGKTDKFLKNAEALNIDIKKVDLVVISHGHYDHGRGIKHLLSANEKAEVFINKEAFDEYYAVNNDGQNIYIGLEQELRDNERISLTDGFFYLDSEVATFSGVDGEMLRPTYNETLKIRIEDTLFNDPFKHEQNLVINEDGKLVLIAGCMHNGVCNIMNHFYDLYECMPDIVIGGLHMMNPSTEESESDEFIKEVADFMLETKAMFYTCHCTGEKAYAKLKEIMGDRIEYLHTGKELRL